MSFTVVIPARYQSVRLAKKLLLDLGGKPVLQRTYDRVRCSKARRIIIATDSREIQKVACGFGAEVLLTSTKHPSGTERIIEAIEKINLADDEIVVNVQGDEPLLPSVLIDEVAHHLTVANTPVATLCTPIANLAQYQDENCVKVVFNAQHQALYFSRASIPHFRHFDAIDLSICYRHIGLYAYRARFLYQYKTQQKSRYEQVEMLEQLGILNAGFNIYVGVVMADVIGGIDTALDLEKARLLFQGT